MRCEKDCGEWIYEGNSIVASATRYVGFTVDQRFGNEVRMNGKTASLSDIRM
jgi:hypothetical protein